MRCGDSIVRGMYLDELLALRAKVERLEGEELRAEVETLKRLCGEVVGIHTIGSYCKDVRSNKFGEVAEKIMQHFNRGNQEEHRKPDCLANVPAVLCEASGVGSDWRGWAVNYNPISKCCAVYEPHRSRYRAHLRRHLKPIHHDPTDAAAEALRSEIEGGGAR